MHRACRVCNTVVRGASDATMPHVDFVASTFIRTFAAYVHAFRVVLGDRVSLLVIRVRNRMNRVVRVLYPLPLFHRVFLFEKNPPIAAQQFHLFKNP